MNDKLHLCIHKLNKHHQLKTGNHIQILYYLYLFLKIILFYNLIFNKTICQSDGSTDTNELKTAWNNMKENYNSLEKK